MHPTLEGASLADELEPYYRSGNSVQVPQATIPADLAWRVIAELRRFAYVLDNDTADLFHYGGDPDEIRDGIDFAMANPECGCDHDPTPMEEETRVCEKCRKRIVV
jgi:hypothetical protein